MLFKIIQGLRYLNEYPVRRRIHARDLLDSWRDDFNATGSPESLRKIEKWANSWNKSHSWSALLTMETLDPLPMSSRKILVNSLEAWDGFVRQCAAEVIQRSGKPNDFLIFAPDFLRFLRKYTNEGGSFYILKVIEEMNITSPDLISTLEMATNKRDSMIRQEATLLLDKLTNDTGLERVP